MDSVSALAQVKPMDLCIGHFPKDRDSTRVRGPAVQLGSRVGYENVVGDGQIKVGKALSESHMGMPQFCTYWLT